MSLVVTVILAVICFRQKRDPAPDLKKLLLKLFLIGMLFPIVYVIAGVLFGDIFSFLDSENPTFFGAVMDAFILTALKEEVGKYLILHLCTRKRTQIQYVFDFMFLTLAIAAGVSISEDILYTLVNITKPSSVWYMRLLFPGHMSYGVFMGIHYGLSKYAGITGDQKGKRHHLVLTLLIPTLLHGLFDFIPSILYFIAGNNATPSQVILFWFIYGIYELILCVSAAVLLVRCLKERKTMPLKEVSA